MYSKGRDVGVGTRSCSWGASSQGMGGGGGCEGEGGGGKKFYGKVFW